MGAAISQYLLTEKSSQGSATSIMWWTMPSISSTVGFAVPMFMRLYTYMESQETTSPLNSFASSTARAVFPEAVGPAIQMMLFTYFRLLTFINPDQTRPVVTLRHNKNAVKKRS